jgi:hypothetical protein
VKKPGPHSGETMASDAPGADLEALFDRARADGFTGAETEELWGRVGAALVAPGAGASPSGAGGPGASAAGGASLGLKMAVALVVGGGLVAGAVAYHDRTPTPAPIVVVPTIRTEVVAAPAAPVVPAPAVSIDDLPRASDPAPAGAKTRPTPDRHDTPRSAARAVDTPESTSPAPEAVVAARTDSASQTSQVPEAPTPRTTVAAAAPLADSTPGGQPRAAAQLDPGPTEGALLLRARQELSSDPSDALALTQEHARRFPSGTLVQEREVLAIEALARLGRSSDARHRLDAFRARFPQSQHIARLAALVGP